MQTETTSKRRKKLSVEEYRHDPEMSLPERAANYLDWAAKNHPRVFTAYNLLLKAIMGYARLPHLDSQEVMSLRARCTRINQILKEKYDRTLVSQPGVGVRATVDSGDVLVNALPSKMRRLESAKNSVVTTSALISPNEIPNTPEYAGHKAWFNRSVKETLRIIGGDDFRKLLEAPREPTVPAPTSALLPEKKVG